jgi:hypothetical protein
MANSSRYIRVNNDEKGDNGSMSVPGVEMAGISEHGNSASLRHDDPSADCDNTSFIVKILLKESSFEIKNLKASSTVNDLKAAIFTVTELPAERQRLIFSGKHLKPTENQLSSFRIKDGSTIHLFPIPVVRTIASHDNIPVADLHNPLALGLRPPQIAVHTPLHFDRNIGQTAREVKIWCLILSFLSLLTLFQVVNYSATYGMDIY